MEGQHKRTGAQQEGRSRAGQEIDQATKQEAQN